MRQFLLGVAITAGLIFGNVAPVAAQNLFEPVVYVNDGAITRYEIDQRIRFMRLIGAPSVDSQTVEDALIDDRLRMQAARSLGIEVTDEGLQAGLEEFAGRARMSAAEFTAALERAGVEPQTYRDFVRAGVAWRGVIRQRLLPRINISDAEVDQEMKRQIETPIIQRVLMSELILPAPPGQEQAVMAQARAIAGSSPNEAQFADAARR